MARAGTLLTSRRENRRRPRKPEDRRQERRALFPRRAAATANWANARRRGRISANAPSTAQDFPYQEVFAASDDAPAVRPERSFSIELGALSVAATQFGAQLVRAHDLNVG